MLKCTNLSVKAGNKIILDDFNLTVGAGEVHAIMGPNGIGKSTICKAIIGEPSFKVKGEIIFNNEDLLKLSITERARKGIYLVNQSPIAIPGVTNAEMLRIALSEKTGEYVSLFAFNQKMEKICDKLSIPRDFIHRGINEGMSGGERKKNELLHLWMLEPSLILLDELDSGLDVDSLKLVCQSINKYKKEYNPSILIITHHPSVLKKMKTTHVHVLAGGKIIKSGDLSLAEEVSQGGFKKYQANNVSENKHAE